MLGDGASALIRAITPDDADALEAFHERQSPDSRYYRYFSPKPRLTNEELDRFTTVDMVDRAALVVELHGEFVAWASYERWQYRDDAEVAFMVDGDHRGKGIATLLLEHLAAIARSNGITRFTAQTLGDNRSMLAVFAKAGWPIHRRFESGVIDVDFPLDDTAEFLDSVERREQRADSRAIARLLLPSSIAVIGASDETGSVGQAIWSNVSARPRCPIYPVNPNHATVGGRPAFDSVLDIPDDVALAVIAVPAAALAATVDECIEKRIRGAVVVTAVSGDDLDVGALVSHARRNGLRIIGPASMGAASPRPATELQAALVRVELPAGRVAISMQSGTMGSSVLRLAHELQLGLSWFVSLGDKGDVSANDLLQFWEDDDATAVVALYTESLGNPRKFARIARRVSRSRPIVVVRSGAALLDSSSAALYRRTGVIEVPTVTALLDTARVFASQPLLGGRRVAIVSNATSPASLARSALESAGLAAQAPPAPLDWRAGPDDYERAIRVALAASSIDGLIVIHAPPVFDAIGAPIDALERACAGAAKPVVAVMLGLGDGPLRPGSAIPAFAFPEPAAAALARLHAYAEWRTTDVTMETDPLADIDRATARSIIAGLLDADTVPPEAMRDLLAAYGVTMPATRLVPADGAVESADELGYPVAVKALRRRRGYSVEAGVALDLRDGEDVANAVATMRRHLGDGADQVHVQSMVPPGLDLRVRAALDERVGPIVSVGLGGIQADVIADEASRLAPISPVAARSLIETTRAAAGLDEDDLDLTADTVARIAQLVSDHPEIEHLDLNPVIVSERTCWVVDAAITLCATKGDAPVRRLE